MPANLGARKKKRLKKQVLVYFQLRQNLKHSRLLVKLKNNHEMEKITIESGGTLNSVLFRKGLIDHVNIVVTDLTYGAIALTAAAVAASVKALGESAGTSAVFSHFHGVRRWEDLHPAPGAPYAPDDAALLVDPYDADAIAAGIVQAVTDEPLRAELAAKGRVRARAFSWAQSVAAIHRIYLEVARR